MPTPAWVVADRSALDGRDGDLLVVTAAETGEVERLRHTGRMLLVRIKHPVVGPLLLGGQRLSAAVGRRRGREPQQQVALRTHPLRPEQPAP